jgi:hypothetical protein
MVIQYTDTTKVAEELRAAQPFSGTTIPSLQTVNRWIEQAKAEIDVAAGIEADITSRVEVFDYEGGEYLYLRFVPVNTVTSLEYNSAALGQTPNWITKTSDVDYFIDNELGTVLINLNTFVPNIGKRNIRVTYESGSTTIPPGHTELATKIVVDRVLSSLLNNNVNESADGGSISVGSISIVEPGAYGVQNYQRLKSDIKQKMTTLLDGAGAYRYRG